MTNNMTNTKAPKTVSVARAASISRRAMMIAWACALGSGTLLDGSLPALVLAGLVAPIWISIYSTLADVEDILSPLVVPIVGRWRPGRTLLGCEIVTATLLVGLAIALIVGAPVGTSVIVYLILVSPIPLILDVADDLYGAELADVSPEGAFDFTSHLHSLSALITQVLAVPMGAALTIVNPFWLVIISLALTSSAIANRLRGVKWEEQAIQSSKVDNIRKDIESEKDASSADVSSKKSSGRLEKMVPIRIFKDALVSPVSVALRGLLAGLLGGYIFIYVGHQIGHSYYVAMLMIAGVGSVLGPQVARILRRKIGSSATVIGGTLLGAIFAILSIVGSAWSAGIIILCAYLFFKSLISMGLISTFVAERQIRLSGAAFITTTTWCYAASAGSALAGSWIAFALNTQSDPLPVLTIAVVCYLVLMLYTIWSVRVSSSQNSPQAVNLPENMED